MSETLSGMFWDFVPREYLRRVLRMLFAAYRQAKASVDERHGPPEAYNLEPMEKRAIIEGQLRDLAVAFPELDAKTIHDRHTNWWNHTRLDCGRVSITQNATSEPEDVVRPSLFREVYAAKNPQKWLVGFEDDAPPPPSPDSVLYGILVHGRDPCNRNELGFAMIRFPTPDLKDWHESRIDLFHEFPEIVAAETRRSQTDVEEEQIDDLPDLEFLDGEDAGGIG